MEADAAERVVVATQEPSIEVNLEEQPPPVAEGPAKRNLYTRFAADAVVTLPGIGRLAYHYSKGAFEATCMNAAHGRCVLSRSNKGKQKKVGDVRLEVGGRPVGFMAKWLLDGKHVTREQHWDKERWQSLYTLAERESARTYLAELAFCDDLVSHERDRGAGEPEEPITLDGLRCVQSKLETLVLSVSQMPAAVKQIFIYCSNIRTWSCIVLPGQTNYAYMTVQFQKLTGILDLLAHNAQLVDCSLQNCLGPKQECGCSGELFLDGFVLDLNCLLLELGHTNLACFDCVVLESLWATSLLGMLKINDVVREGIVFCLLLVVLWRDILEVLTLCQNGLLCLQDMVCLGNGSCASNHTCLAAVESLSGLHCSFTPIPYTLALHSEMPTAKKRVLSVVAPGPGNAQGSLGGVRALLSDGSSQQKKVKKGDACICAACGTTPQDKGKTKEVWHDAKWALNERKKGSETLVPVGDRCELCSKTWTTAFGWLEWPEVLAEMQKKDMFKEFFFKAKERIQSAEGPIACASHMTKLTKYSVQVSRLYTVASEKELKGSLAQARLNKWQVKSLPTAQIPSESCPSELETVYVFRNPHASPLRELRVVGEVEILLGEHMVKPESSFFAEHCSLALEQVKSKDPTTSVLTNLLGKEPDVETFEAWFDLATKNKSENDGEEGGGDEQPVEEDAGDIEMVGVEAESANKPGGTPNIVRKLSFTPPSKKPVTSPDGLLDAQSVSTALTAIGVSWLAVLQGDEAELMQWKQKFDPQVFFSKDADLRSLRAIDNAVIRYEGRDRKALSMALTNYVKILRLCDSFGKLDLSRAKRDQITSALIQFKAESIKLPVNICTSLLERKANELMEENNFASILEVLNPFDTEADEFDPLNPTLSSLPVLAAAKCATFNKLIIEKLLVSHIELGSEGHGKVQRLAHTALNTFKDVDYLYLDMNSAKLFSEQETIWKAILCLTCDTLERWEWQALLASLNKEFNN
eukprot:6491562-Amphidinium_carterae.1